MHGQIYMYLIYAIYLYFQELFFFYFYFLTALRIWQMVFFGVIDIVGILGVIKNVVF